MPAFSVIPLRFRSYGPPAGMPLVVLHGLLGSARNWDTAARGLAAERRVIVPDLRNHGLSPHADSNTYEDMAGDVSAFLRAQEIGEGFLLGHSMGGKLAMKFAVQHPETVRALVVVDMAPGRTSRSPAFFDRILAMPLDALHTYAEAEAWLVARGETTYTARFLVTNLTRDQAGGFSWRPNMPVLAEHGAHLLEGVLPAGAVYGGPALFLLGGKSQVVRAEDQVDIRRHFPGAEITVMEGCGHSPHIECRAEFVRRVGEFIHRCSGRLGRAFI